ncbi:MAG: DNA polymerase III subunit delta, partial [Helicobacter sp.]|nr:DNA polymerase III subunit delta [Helicobacter sp.]
MYQKELDAKLNNNVPIKAILLYGEDSFLIGYYGDKIAKKLLSQDCDTYYFYFNDLVYENVCSCFLQESLFGNQSFVCLKIDKKIPKKELDKWLSILKKNQSGYLVVEFYQAENRNAAQYMQDCKAMAASFRGEDVFEARFFKPYLKDSLMILQEYAKDLGVKISEFSL